MPTTYSITREKRHSLKNKPKGKGNSILIKTYFQALEQEFSTVHIPGLDVSSVLKM